MFSAVSQMKFHIQFRKSQSAQRSCRSQMLAQKVLGILISPWAINVISFINLPTFQLLVPSSGDSGILSQLQALSHPQE